MSKTKFTPGPWEAGKNPCMTTVLDGKEGKTIYPKGSFYHIAWTNAENSDGDFDIKTALANASLIAAAPEMYEQLDFFLDYIKKHFPERGKIIEKILKKARGKE